MISMAKRFQGSGAQSVPLQRRSSPGVAGWRAVSFICTCAYAYLRGMIQFLSDADNVLKVLGTLASVLAAFFGLRSLITKQKAEAMKQVQDVYQETIKDLRDDRREMRSEFERKISEQNDRLRDQDGKLLEQDRKIQEQSEQLSRVDKKIGFLEAHKCLRKDCAERLREQ